MKVQHPALPAGKLFSAEKTDLSSFLHRPRRLAGGAVIFCTAGKARISLDLNEFPIQGSTEIFVFPGSVLSLAETDEDLQTLAFFFSPSLFDEAKYRIDPPFFRFVKEHPTYDHPDASAQTTRTLFSSAFAVLENQDERFLPLVARNFLQIFLLDIYRRAEPFFAATLTQNNGRREELFHRYIDLVVEHCTRHRQVSFYAEKLCVSMGYLSDTVQKVAGESPKAILDKHIVQEIKVLLTSSGWSVQQIAEKLRFPDQSYLGRYFKRHTGLSPMKYRDK